MVPRMQCTLIRRVAWQARCAHRSMAVIVPEQAPLGWSQAPSPSSASAAPSGGKEADVAFLSRDRLAQLMQAEVRHFATLPATPTDVSTMLQREDPKGFAEYLQEDVPKRFAARIQAIERLEGWDSVPELKFNHQRLCQWYQAIRLVRLDTRRGVKDFVACCRRVRQEEDNQTVQSISVGMHKLLRIHTLSGIIDDVPQGEQFYCDWMDDFLLSRIGTNTLFDQYVCTAPQEVGGLGRQTGVVDPNCDATQICKQAVTAAQQVCKKVTGKVPTVEVRGYVEGMDGPQPDAPCVFTYIPGSLQYILIELIKNSFTATIKNSDGDEDMARRPVKILICRDEQRVAIRVSDRAGGIPFTVGDKIWSYFYGAAASSVDDAKAPKATPLAGYGVGLPLSRLRAVYLGGHLAMTTYPGYGTDAHILLPRIQESQREVLPKGYPR